MPPLSIQFRKVGEDWTNFGNFPHGLAPGRLTHGISMASDGEHFAIIRDRVLVATLGVGDSHTENFINPQREEISVRFVHKER